MRALVGFVGKMIDRRQSFDLIITFFSYRLGGNDRAKPDLD